MNESISIKIPAPIIEFIQRLIELGTTGFETVEEFIAEALLQDIECTLESPTGGASVQRVMDDLRARITS